MLSGVFQILGLKEKDEQIYLTALELGTMQPASVIARVSGFKRIDVYNHLRDMARMGVFNIHDRNGVLYFEAHDILSLKSMAQRRMARFGLEL